LGLLGSGASQGAFHIAICSIRTKLIPLYKEVQEMQKLTFILLVVFSLITFCSTANALDAPKPGTPWGPCNDNLPTFSWSTVPDATKYKIIVKNLDTGSIVFKRQTVATSYTPPLTDRLEWGTQYRWWVRAYNDTEGWSPRSLGRRFSTICEEETYPDVVGDWAVTVNKVVYRSDTGKYH